MLTRARGDAAARRGSRARGAVAAARVRSAELQRAARRVGRADARRRARRESRGLAARVGRGRARSLPRLRGGERPRRALQRGRPRREERDGLRRAEAARGVVGHARGAHDGHAARRARAGDGAHAARAGRDARRGRRRARRRARLAARRLGRGVRSRRGCLLRLEGFAPSVAARAAALAATLRPRDDRRRSRPRESRARWNEIGGAAALARWPVVWRISVAPTDAPRVLAALEPERYLARLGRRADLGRVRATSTRRACARAVRAGHATLFKAPPAARASTPVFQPQPPALAAVGAALEARVRSRRPLNPGRLG